ncbi:DUF5685 family protein [Fervidobacterium sp.]
MFGYVKPMKIELKLRELNEFKAFYCGVCTSLQRARYLAKFFLSYDSIFFALLLTSLKGKTLSYRKRFCEIGFRKVAYFESDDISLAATNFILLLKYKLLDDVKDERNFVKLVLLSILKNFPGENPHLEERLTGLLAELGILERYQVPSIDQPANIFGEIVAIFFHNLEDISPEQKVVLVNLAKHVGRWIYVLDAFDDLEKDVQKRNYNPFLLQFKYEESADIRQFIDKIRPQVREYLFKILDDVILAYNLLELKTYKGILDNIVYLGLFEETERILNGKKTCRKA